MPKIEVGSPTLVPVRQKLTVLLEGGGGESLFVEHYSPLHHQLRAALAGELAPGTLLDLPLRPEVTLTIPASRLIGLLTEPEQITLTAPPAIAQVAAPPAVEAPVGVLVPGEPDGITLVTCAQVPDVFSPDDHAKLLAFVRRSETSFVGTTTSTKRDNYRASSVLYNFAPFDEMMRSKIRQLLPAVCQALKINDIPKGSIEAQLTAHNDDNFYKVHNDNGSADTAHRVLTFVYYFHDQPKNFTGGELLVYDHKVKGGYHYAAETYRTIQPMDNSIVFFASQEMHEVTRVSCPSLKFMDSRFTINGWVGK